MGTMSDNKNRDVFSFWRTGSLPAPSGGPRVFYLDFFPLVSYPFFSMGMETGISILDVLIKLTGAAVVLVLFVKLALFWVRRRRSREKQGFLAIDEALKRDQEKLAVKGK